MKLCHDCGIVVASNYPDKFIMKCDFNDMPCQRPISDTQNCNNKSKFTIIIEPKSTQHLNTKVKP